MRMPEITDEEIAARVQQGDIKSFDLLLERYEKKIMRYARKFLSNSEDAKDTVQEVFIKAYVNLRSFDTRGRFSPWLYRIAHNEFINAIRKKKTEKVFFFDLDVFFPHLAASEKADGNINSQDLRKILNESLEKLPAKYREPLILYYFEDMDYKEIAEILHVPISTVGVRLKRGKAMLKKIVKV